jgi:hypothetical protein
MPSNPKETYLTIPDNTLRKKIGRRVALADIFTAEKLQHCQQLLDQAQKEFIQEMETQLNEIGSAYIKAMENPAQVEEALKKAAETIFIIKKRMESLNFVFGYSVAKSLSDYLQATPTRDSDSMIVVCKHLAVLNIILKDSIKGDGGVVGKEMMGNLQSLIQKTRKQ